MTLTNYERIENSRAVPIGGPGKKMPGGAGNARSRAKRIAEQCRRIMEAIAVADEDLRVLHARLRDPSEMRPAGITSRIATTQARKRRLLDSLANLRRQQAAMQSGQPDAKTATKPAAVAAYALLPTAPVLPVQPIAVAVQEPAPVDLGVPLPAERVRPDDITYPSRDGQQQFRTMILAAYGRCAVTGCQDQAVLQAAHVIPYVDARSNVLRNGICLRADIHCLYDRNLIRIGADGVVSVDQSVTHWSYRDLDGAFISGSAKPDAALMEVRHRYVAVDC